MEISSPAKDKFMDRRPQRDQPQEGTAKLTGKAGKAGPPPWELKPYIFKEETEDTQRSSHCDPRLELALQDLSLHQDDFIPFDDDRDHGSGYLASGLGVTSDLNARASTASDQGTLAGGEWSNRVFYKAVRESAAREVASRQQRGKRGSGTDNIQSHTGQTTGKRYKYSLGQP